MKPFLSFLFLLTLLLSACQPATQPAPGPISPTKEAEIPASQPDSPVSSDENPEPRAPSYEPQPGDEKLQPGTLYINSSELLTLESYPPQFVLSVSGELPDPCHQLRARVNLPDENGRIEVQLYTLVDPDTLCIQVLQPFDMNLALGSFPAGEYELYLNGEKVADFQS